MNLKNLEKGIEIMEETLKKMQEITQDVEEMDNQVDDVREDLTQGKKFAGSNPD